MNAPLEIQLAHALQRRIRVLIPSLKGDREGFYLLEILLRKRPAIREVRSECRIGSLTIHFDPAAITRTDLLAAVTQIATVLARSPRKFRPERKAVPEGPLQHSSRHRNRPTQAKRRAS